MQSLPTPYQEFIHLSRYARWRDDLGRREMWPETDPALGELLDPATRGQVRFLHQRSRGFREPALRSHLGARRDAVDAQPHDGGPALERDNVAGFNCAYVEIDDLMAFAEVMYNLMCGTGVGFSVERQCVKRLPEIPESLHDTSTVITVEDSKLGWCAAFRQLISLLYAGQVPQWDLSRVRPKGSRLMTFGGRASGPEPLDDLFNSP
jgi:ribonucleoside-triphosphate reductase